MWRSIFILFMSMLLLVLLGFMHQLDEPKTLSHWEEVGNPPLQHSHSRAASGGSRKNFRGAKQKCDSNIPPTAARS